MWHKVTVAGMVALVGVCGLVSPAGGQDLEALQRMLVDVQAQINELKKRENQRAMIEEVLREMGYEADPLDLRLHWGNGLRMTSRDESISLKFGGRLMYDFGWVSGEDMEALLGTELADGSETRRARMYIEADFWDRIKAKVQWDWADGDAALKDAYIELTRLPIVGNLRMGHFKEPFSLNELTSSKYITFLERALPNAFAPSRNAGFMIHNHAFDKRVTWAAGIFRDTDDDDGGEGLQDGDYAFTTRVTWLPLYEDKGRHLLHVGGAYSYRSAEASSIGYSVRPEAHFTEKFIDFSLMEPVDHLHLFGAEVAYVNGPFHMQAEYIAARPEFGMGSSYGDACFSGWYVQAGYFLTGECRPYKTSSGTFDRVKPLKPYGKEGGTGAWEVAGRYSVIDFDDGDIQEGSLRDITLGINWYLNPNVRIMWNYICSRLEESSTEEEESAHIFLMRLQVDF
jgi:phosphate-selective porin OprO/OprP